MGNPTEKPKQRKQFLTLPTRILVGLFAGISCGLFFGDYCGHLKPLGQAFVDLLQMTVLPYVVVAIVLQIGRLSWRELRRMAIAGGAVLLMLWGVGAIVILLLPQALPTWRAGSFYSTSTIEVPKSTSLLEQIITPNPFNALANGIIPAIVLFSIMVGMALSGIERKQGVLDLLESADLILRRVTNSIVKLTPLGVFAIAASTTGTLQVAELSRLQGYLILQVGATLVLVFWLVPLLISLVTPFSYGEIVHSSRAIIITAFATGKVLVVIPMVIETAQELVRRRETFGEEAADSVEAIVPLAYPFPHLGRIISLLFIPFAAWFIGDPMDLSDYGGFLPTGYLSMFGSTVVGIPYLLDAQQLPADLFQLFLASGVICGRLSDMAGAMHLYAMALMTPALLNRQRFFMPSRLIVGAAVSVLLVGGMIVSSRAYLHSTLQDLLQDADVVNRMHSPLTVSPPTVYQEVPPADSDLSQFESRIDRVRAHGELRVGYHRDNLPFSFFNEQGKLVGFDIDMAHLMAEDLDMKLVLIPFEFETLADQLDRGDFDIAMSGISVTPTRLLRMSLSDPYMNSTLAFVVKDHLRREFSTSESLAGLTDVTIAVPRSNYFESRLKRYLPQAKVVFIESPREFFVRGELDAMLANAEAGSAWTIQYPSYAVAVPQPDVFSVPLGYAVPQGDSRLMEFVNQWIELKRGRPTYNTLYNHWIYGKDPTHNRPRWCVIRDVLHWVD